jgi:hypothetical protein
MLQKNLLTLALALLLQHSAANDVCTVLEVQLRLCSSVASIIIYAYMFAQI